jgi:hypothetical protein
VLFAQGWVPQEQSLGGNRGRKVDRDAGHLMPQFLIVIQKQYLGNLSIRKDSVVARSGKILEKNKRTQRIFMKLRQDLRSGSSKVRNDFQTN